MKNSKKFSGYADDCSPEQLEALRKFRIEVDNITPGNNYDDHYLLRFLRARKFDLPKTLVMWNNLLKWRAEKNADHAREIAYPEIIEAKKYYPHGFFRTDKLGRPMYFERIGYLKIDQFNKIMTPERMEGFSIQKYERLMHEILPGASRAAGKRVEQIFFVIDLKNFKSGKKISKVIDLVKLMSTIGTNYYPETLGVMFIVNTPMVFYGLWNVFKYVLDEETRDKINILGSNYKKELLKFVDEEDLPDFLGGKTTSADYGENFTKEEGPWVAKTPSFSQIEKHEEQEEEEFIVKNIENLKIKELSSSPEKIQIGGEYRDEFDLEELGEVAFEGARTHLIREFRSQPSLHM